MHIGNAILCIADRGCLLLSVSQLIFPPINLLVLKILLPDVFNFLAVLFSTAFFFGKEIMRAICARDPIVSWVLSMLIFSNSLWLCIMCATAPNQTVPPDVFSANKQLKRQNMGCPNIRK